MRSALGTRQAATPNLGFKKMLYTQRTRAAFLPNLCSVGPMQLQSLYVPGKGRRQIVDCGDASE
jgi:hypothetical protein